MKPNRITPAPRRQHGLSLVEIMIGLAIAAVTAGAALPGFKAATERRALEGAAAQLETDIQFARSLAVAQGHSLRLGFETHGGASCYIIHSGSSGACSCAAAGPAVCRGTARALRSVRFEPGGAVQVASNAASLGFDPHQGTVTPTATMRVLGTSGAAVHEVISMVGRIRSCTPTQGLQGWRPC